jgi:hypothetical protein
MCRMVVGVKQWMSLASIGECKHAVLSGNQQSLFSAVASIEQQCTAPLSVVQQRQAVRSSDKHWSALVKKRTRGQCPGRNLPRAT